VDIIVTVLNRNDESVRNVRCEGTERVVVGRGPESGVMLDSPAISREHLIIEEEDGGFRVTDVSANGCWINGERAVRARRTPVGDADTIDLPGFEVRIRRIPRTESRSLSAMDETVAVSAPVLPRGGMAGRLTAPVMKALGSFTGTEKFAAVAALCALAMVLVYAFA
jgi:pSer/pThr/pTyr-binding forkhead associated (FHA) protein